MTHDQPDKTGRVAKKLGIKEGTRAFFVNAPVEAVDAMDPPTLELATELAGDFDYIHLFVTTQDTFNDIFPRLKAHLKPKGMLWVSWPKQGKLNTDLNLPIVIKLGYNHGLVESKCISINAIWSALKFTHPTQGKVYNNSYGQLKL